MVTIWTPPKTRLPRAVLPEGDKTLADGRLLKRLADFRPDPCSQGAIYETSDGLRVIASMDDTVEHGVLLHVSASRRDRDPSWDEIKMIREAFYPLSVDVMMVLPRAEDYVNIHEHCFHLWQTPESWGIR